MNIKLLYLYRDGGNYKQYGEEVYTNKNALALADIRDYLTNFLIEGQWFYASDWNLKDLHYYPYNAQIDHDYHEFDDVEETKDNTTKGDIQELILLLQGKLSS